MGGIMTFSEFKSILETAYMPVILLEGRRKVKAEDSSKLTQIAAKLAENFPFATFRTGNADGSDTLFAQGVAGVDPSRIEYVVPYPGMKKKNRVEGARLLSLDGIDRAEDDEVAYLTSSQKESTARLVEYGRTNPETRTAAKVKYLLRDTLKVTGSASAGFRKPVAALFYIDPAVPDAGGTGHTIAVCRELNVPVAFQQDWMKWLEEL